jgi:hypothetical protein
MADVRALCAGLIIVLGAHLASAQDGASPAPGSAAPGVPSAPEGVSQKASPTREGLIAQILKPELYDPAFYTGAQAELVVPDAGVSSLIVGYDAVWLHVDLSLGLGVGNDPVLEQDGLDTYILAVRIGFPVHRGIRSDFSIVAGGGATVVQPPGRGTHAFGTAAAGARFRVFMTPNVAVGATLGLAGFIHGEHSSVVLGARPLGAASVVYFFR